MDLKYSGSFGLILRAKQEGIITSIRPIIERVRSTNFRYSDKLLESLLEQAGE